MTGPVGVVTGLRFEARIIARAAQKHGPDAILPPRVAGGSTERAYEAGLALADAGARALLSFGIGGGLDPRLVPGSIVVTGQVSGDQGLALGTDSGWRHGLAARLGLQPLPIVSLSQAVSDPKQKYRLAATSGAALVDMESHGVARAAAVRGLPFYCLRTVADPVNRGLPAAALAGFGPDGGTRPLAVLQALLRDPRQLKALIQLARDSHAARKALGRVAFDQFAALLGLQVD